MRKTLAALATLAFAASCQGGSRKETPAPTPPAATPAAAPTTTPPPAAAPAPAPAPPPAGLVLLDPGAEPRRVLRYDIAPGTQQRFEVVVDQTAKMAQGPMPEMKLPTTQLSGTIVFAPRAAEGAMPYALTIDKVDFLDTPGASMSAAQLRQMVGPLGGVKATAVLDPQGTIHGFQIDLAKLPPQTQKMLEGMTYDQMAARLPEQPIGKGARWRVVQHVVRGAIRLVQTTDVELVELRGNRARLKNAVTIEAPPQKVAQGGGTAELKKMIGQGTADVRIDLGKLLGPATMAMHIDQEMTMGAQTLSVAVDEATKLSPR